MATLQNKTVVIIGGSSGIGYAVALASLQSLDSLVVIASSNQTRLDEAIQRLKSHNLQGKIRGEVLDTKDSTALKSFAGAIGVVDHIVWTSGDVPRGPTGPTGGMPFSNIKSVEEGQGEEGQGENKSAYIIVRYIRVRRLNSSIRLIKPSSYVNST